MGSPEHIVHPSTLKFGVTNGDLKDNSDKAPPTSDLEFLPNSDAHAFPFLSYLRPRGFELPSNDNLEASTLYFYKIG